MRRGRRRNKEAKGGEESMKVGCGNDGVYVRQVQECEQEGDRGREFACIGEGKGQVVWA